MNLINNQNYITNKQVIKLIKLLGNKYTPSKLIICENRKDILRIFRNHSLTISLINLLSPTVWLGKLEGLYYQDSDAVFIFIFSQNDDGEDKQSKQLYSIHALTHELRHRWQVKTNYVGDEEIDADEFATYFVNQNGRIIAKIMKWDDEWEVEEED